VTATNPTLAPQSHLRATGAKPLRLLVASFALLIAAGTLLLWSPAATPVDRPITLLDAAFTATSAACVTGLVVRDTGTGFTLFGQSVILALIQLGGIGIMTLSLFLFSLLGRRFSIGSRFIVSQALAGAGGFESLWTILGLVVRFTFLTEAVGAGILFLRWSPELGATRAAYAGAFHAVSAFCNAGFSLWATSLIRYRGDLMVNVVVVALIVLGGLGFLVVSDLIHSLRARRLALHSRIVLVTSGALLVIGACALWALERQDSLAGLPLGEQWMAAVFQSATARTAGFNTIDLADLTPPGLFVLMILMFVGGSPGSCAGGVKTTVLAALALAAWTRVRGRHNVTAFRRTLTPDSVTNAVTIAFAGALVVLGGLFALLLLQAPHADARSLHGEFVAYLFESVSALGTVGLSMGVTEALSPMSRILVMGLMFLGRLGPLTVAAALARDDPSGDWQYPQEEIAVG
jgi:trk system potassium uptake protein TrkH